MNIIAPLESGWKTAAPARCVSIAVIASLSLALSVSSAAAGFFDFLFAPLQPAAPVSRPPARIHYRPAHVERRAHLRAPKKAVAARPHNIVEAKAPTRPAQAVGLMDDDSLRDGDAVMTEGGIRVFVGSEGLHHGPDDFARIAESEGLSRRQRAALAAIEPRDKKEAQPVLLAGRSVADRGLSAGEMIVDPRGNRIRYVGP